MTIACRIPEAVSVYAADGIPDPGGTATGRQEQPASADATALQHGPTRCYDLSIGRWVSEEPVAFAGGDPNLYRYAHPPR